MRTIRDSDSTSSATWHRKAAGGLQVIACANTRQHYIHYIAAHQHASCRQPQTCMHSCSRQMHATVMALLLQQTRCCNSNRHGADVAATGRSPCCRRPAHPDTPVQYNQHMGLQRLGYRAVPICGFRHSFKAPALPPFPFPAPLPLPPLPFLRSCPPDSTAAVQLWVCPPEPGPAPEPGCHAGQGLTFCVRRAKLP